MKDLETLFNDHIFKITAIIVAPLLIAYLESIIRG